MTARIGPGQPENSQSTATNHSEPTPTLNGLPVDALRLALSFLPREDLPRAALTSRAFHQTTIDSANIYQPRTLQTFIKNILDKLPEAAFPVQRTSLNTIEQGITPQNCASLVELKEYLLGKKDLIVEVLKTLDSATVMRLKIDTHLPNFLEDIFKVTALERRIHAAHLITNEYTRSNTLLRISKALVQTGNFVRAIDTAALIPDHYTREAVLSEISNALVQTGNFDRAIDVAALIPHQATRGAVLSEISNALVQAGNFVRANAQEGVSSRRFPKL